MVVRERTTGVDLSVELCGMTLSTPLVPASGTLAKEALGEVGGVYGAILPKTTTPAARKGNPPPRVAETPAGMVNSIGLQNPGVERFMEDLDAFDLGVPIFVSVAGETVRDFAALCERVSDDARVAAIELNLSCPNVEHGGLTFCAGPAAVDEVVAACRHAAPAKPLFAKLTHEGVVGNATAAEAAGADALTVMNTIPALTIDVKRRSVLVRGGLSGPAVKPVALKAVHDVARTANVPILGGGGVTSGTDVAEFMLAGATVV
ncbi:MAG TPA: dihydroorotate dehydrogenase catalytic subunit, partial [Rubrobacter sp.]|nr:dihydroorotate dehydrogenase catalytic subunit [Rubrobacter sp.]